MNRRFPDPFRFLRWVPLLVLGLLASATICAQATDRCTRLRDEGIRLHEAGDAKHALPKLEEAQRCRPAAQMLLYIGLSQRELGKLEEALTSFKRAKEGAGDDVQLAELADRGIADVVAKRGSQASPSSDPKPIEPKRLTENQPDDAARNSDPQPPPVWGGDAAQLRKKKRLAGWILLGIGAFGVAAGSTLLGIDGIPTCSQEPREIRCPQEINTWPAGTALIAVGGSAVIAGTALLILARPKDERPIALRSRSDSAGIGIAGSF